MVLVATQNGGYIEVTLYCGYFLIYDYHSYSIRFLYIFPVLTSVVLAAAQNGSYLRLLFAVAYDSHYI
jgi:hypothetical protein